MASARASRWRQGRRGPVAADERRLSRPRAPRRPRRHQRPAAADRLAQGLPDSEAAFRGRGSRTRDPGRPRRRLSTSSIGAAVRELEPALVRPFARAMLLTETGVGARAWPAGRGLRGAVLGPRRTHACAAASRRLSPEDRTGWHVAAFRTAQSGPEAGGARGGRRLGRDRAGRLGYRFAVAAERGYHRHYALHPDSPAARRARCSIPAPARSCRRWARVASASSPASS